MVRVDGDPQPDAQITLLECPIGLGVFFASSKEVISASKFEEHSGLVVLQLIVVLPQVHNLPNEEEVETWYLDGCDLKHLFEG